MGYMQLWILVVVMERRANFSLARTHASPSHFVREAWVSELIIQFAYLRRGEAASRMCGLTSNVLDCHHPYAHELLVPSSV